MNAGTLSALTATLSDKERKLLLEALAPKATIAIVGIGCRFPGGSSGPDAFWRLLDRGGDAVAEIPSDRWDVADYFDPDPDAPGRMLTRYGAFLDRVDLFDPSFFEISPHEARQMDPQQRLLLEVTWEALENAGQPAERLRKSKTGVFVGGCSTDYDELPRGHADAHTLTGGLLSVLSGRVSYALDLQGPSLTVDTACSSSLVALHLACQSLRKGECELAIAGGVNVIVSPEGYVRLSRMRALSPDGRCRTFDAAANGYARGEGAGVVVLKRLEDARRDSDRVWAVIRGSAVNHDGRSTGLTAPNGLSQREVIEKAFEDAGVEAAAVDYIEAHGTGTPLGDPIEAETLREIFAGKQARPCVIGSVKTNVGHLEAAAGIAGVIKVVLAMAKEKIPQHLHFTRLNPRIELGGVLEVPARGKGWPKGHRARIAGVSSFGISGTNAHVVIAEPPVAPPEPKSEDGPVVVPLSAQSPAALAALARSWAEVLRAADGPTPRAVAHTAATRRTHLKHRAAVTGETREELARALESVTVTEAAGDDQRPKIIALGANTEALLRKSGVAPDAVTGPADASSSIVIQHAGRASESINVDTPRALRDALARLYTSGVDIDWRAVYPEARAPTPLPGYPWQHERYWINTEPAKSARPRATPNTHALLGEGFEVPVDNLHIWRAELDGATHPWLLDHRVGGAPVLPAAAILDMALWAGRTLGLGPFVTSPVFERRIEIPEAKGATKELQLVIRPGPPARFDLFARPNGGTWQLKAHGTFGEAGDHPNTLDIAASKSRLASAEVAALYTNLSKGGFQHGARFKSIRALWSGTNEALAEVRLPAGLDPRGHALHPALLDGCLQVAAAAAIAKNGMPVAVRAVRLPDAPVSELWCRAVVRESADRVEADLILAGPDGRPLGWIDGFAVEVPKAAAIDGAAPPRAAFAGGREAILEIVTETVRETLGFDPSLRIPPTQDLRDLGLDSMLALNLTADLERKLSRTLSNSFALDYPSIAEMAEALASEGDA